MTIERTETSLRAPGWWRWAGLALVVGLLALLIGGALSTRRMLALGISRAGRKVLAAVPADTPPAKRQALQFQIDCVIRAVHEERLSDQEIAEFGQASARMLRAPVVTARELDDVARVAESMCERAYTRGMMR